ncbi:hypothetical protein L6452_08450 [Arctium lappa]|uniref:Uncharacterized protein n=1 Tax=Arctium lappa TaxID=4217 RepID=A0ACB9DHA7_ARCLA|nr:hypothetical protein L6452_08450 [Arctium lappa]
MVNTRSHLQSSPEGQAVNESTTDRPNATVTDGPPIPPMLVGRVEQIPRTVIATADPIVTEVTPQTQMMDMIRSMNETMAKQQELFMKLLEDREGNQRRHETIEENVVIAGYGGTEGEIRTDGLATLETRQPERGCSYKSFLCYKPPEFAGSDEPAKCMSWLKEIEQAFRSSDCEERQKVKYGSQLLRVTTLTWWNVFTSTIEESVLGKMSWT